jgi:hypothetical protein
MQGAPTLSSWAGRFNRVPAMLEMSHRTLTICRPRVPTMCDLVKVSADLWGRCSIEVGIQRSLDGGAKSRRRSRAAPAADAAGAALPARRVDTAT